MQSGLDIESLWKTNPEEARRLQMITEAQMDRARANPLPSFAQTLSAQDLARIPFPERKDAALADYGFKHHSETAKLAYRIGEFLALDTEALTALKNAAMLHDLGRRIPWPNKDPGHQQRSAEAAEKVMREDLSVWGEKKLREQTCWIIANHNMDQPPPSDGRLIALWDAECYEQCRFAVGTREGIQSMKAGFERVITAWAKHVEYQERWRAHRGWK